MLLAGLVAVVAMWADSKVQITCHELETCRSVSAGGKETEVSQHPPLTQTKKVSPSSTPVYVHRRFACPRSEDVSAEKCGFDGDLAAFCSPTDDCRCGRLGKQCSLRNNASRTPCEL